MGSFKRQGSFQDRTRFLAAFRGKIDRLKEGALRGMNETWAEAPGSSKATFAAFGVSIVFTVGESAWDCAAEIPAWLPIPTASIEEKFDREFADLKGL